MSTPASAVASPTANEKSYPRRSNSGTKHSTSASTASSAAQTGGRRPYLVRRSLTDARGRPTIYQPLSRHCPMSDDNERRREARAHIELKVEYKRLNTFFY